MMTVFVVRNKNVPKEYKEVISFGLNNGFLILNEHKVIRYINVNIIDEFTIEVNKEVK